MAAEKRVGAAPAADRTLVEPAFAKINLTLRVVGRRADGYHEIESLVGFAALSDRLALRPGPRLELHVAGPAADQAGPVADNLVLSAAHALAERVTGLTLGHFGLIKRLPAGAGLGGSSADAAAALRLLALANDLEIGDARVRAAARATGADVPVCLESRPRWMRGVGEILSDPVTIPKQFAVVVHPGVALATGDVFRAVSALPGGDAPAGGDVTAPAERRQFVAFLAEQANDLEPVARGLCPIISDVLSALRSQPGCALARMSGSGSACFGLFASRAAATLGARAIASEHSGWWVQATVIGDVI